MHDTTLTDKSVAIHTPMTPAKGLLSLISIIVVVAVFVGLNSWIGIADFWAGFLFVLYWSGVEHMKMERLPHCIVGAALGLLVSYGLQTLPHAFGTLGIIIPLAVIILMVYCQVMSWLPILVNTATMLFLTVATIPALQMHGNFISVLSGFGIGVVFFVTLAIGGNALKEKFTKHDSKKVT